MVRFILLSYNMFLAMQNIVWIILAIFMGFFSMGMIGISARRFVMVQGVQRIFS